MSSHSEHTVLTPASGFDVSKIRFSEPVAGTIPDSKPKIEFKRINIRMTNEDGSEGELVLSTERLFSFGVSENTSQETGKVNGYTFPLCLWNRDNPTEAEKAWTNTFNAIVNQCIDHLVENREEIDMFELQRSDLTKSKGGLNPLYWKKEKHTNSSGKTVLRPVPGTGPTLYTKLIFSKKQDKFLSQFFDQNDDPVDPMQMMGKYCYTRAAVKIESIFIGSRISLQVKLYEAVVEPTSGGMKRLLQRPKAQSRVLAAAAAAVNPMGGNDDDDDDDELSVGSIEEDADEPVELKVKAATKKPARKVIKRVARKST